MSRHRFVRNININEELEEDEASDGGYEDLSAEDYEHMMNGMEHIRRILGDEQQSGLSDADIKDSLYHYYFDVEQATQYLLEEQERRRVAQERKDWTPYDANGKPLPMPPMAPPEDYADWSPPSDTASGRHNVPFVRLTQSEYVSSSEQETTRASTRPGSLYTITEMTERTEDSRDWPPPVPHHHPPPFTQMQMGGSRTTILSSITTDYGQVIERPPLPIDPNEIPPSPSSSALRRLSLDGLGSPTGPPQIDYSSPSETTDSSRPPTVIELPTMDNMPDIPDYKSKSSLPLPQAQSQASLLTKKSMKAVEEPRSVQSSKTETTERSQRSEKTGKKSKLSALASSRASAKSKSTVSSVSSHSSVTETEVATAMSYPALRPAAASFLSLIPPPRPPSISTATESTTPSSLTRNVEMAIQSALALEAIDRQAPETEASIPASTVPPTPPPKSPPLRTRTPSDMFTQPSVSPSPIPLPPTVFPNAASRTSSSHSANVSRSPPAFTRSPPVSPPRPQSTASPSTSAQPQFRQLSKLAKLAQAKAQEQGKVRTHSPAQHNLIIPRTHTEYFTPTANGPTATTAITTSYQSLSGLLSKNQLKVPPPVTQPPLSAGGKAGGTSSSQKSSEPKQSKLAMKSKSARVKASTEPEPEPQESMPVVEVPMFSSSAIRSKAAPSAFATLLVNDEPETVSASGSDGTGTYLCQHHKAEREYRRSKDRSDATTPRSLRHKERDAPLLPPGPLPLLRGFAFDVPSPDDVVFSARKGSSLAQRSTSSTQSALSASAR
ncbi:hypothetical protein C8Q80DRAFT_1157328 [Daedaleopsis nitida]|nr:hypothetical protein C8Q80DRAFT_1157328 [Daedaleopsis nitida]